MQIRWGLLLATSLSQVCCGVDSKVAALTEGTAVSSAVTAQNTTVTMRPALLPGKMAQEAQVYSGDKVDTTLTYPSVSGD